MNPERIVWTLDGETQVVVVAVADNSSIVLDVIAKYPSTRAAAIACTNIDRKTAKKVVRALKRALKATKA